MRIIKPYMRMTEIDANTGIRMLRDIEAIGRVSHRSEDAQSEDSWRRFLKAVVLDHGDWSIVEHVNVRVEAYVDRGITHEIVRHRIGAYTQESTRFVNYEKKIPPSFVYPKSADLPEGFWPESGVLEITAVETDSVLDFSWLRAIHHCEQSYIALLNHGWRPQEARSVFPNALASKIIITYNLRMWRHFFLMRTSKEAHPQMREVTIPLLKQFQQEIPILFDDIVPESRQADNMKLGR